MIAAEGAQRHDPEGQGGVYGALLSNGDVPVSGTANLNPDSCSPNKRLSLNTRPFLNHTIDFITTLYGNILKLSGTADK